MLSTGNIAAKENAVPDFLKLLFYWEWDQGSRQRITKEIKLSYNAKWYMGLGSPKHAETQLRGVDLVDVSPET